MEAKGPFQITFRRDRRARLFSFATEVLLVFGIGYYTSNSIRTCRRCRRLVLSKVASNRLCEILFSIPWERESLTGEHFVHENVAP